MSAAGKTLRVRLLRSRHGRLRRHRACLDGLGLRRIGHEVELEDTPSVRGMIRKVSYMVEVVGEAAGTDAAKQAAGGSA